MNKNENTTTTKATETKATTKKEGKNMKKNENTKATKATETKGKNKPKDVIAKTMVSAQVDAKNTDFDFGKMLPVKRAAVMEYIKAVKSAGKISSDFDKEKAKIDAKFSAILKKEEKDFNQSDKDKMKVYTRDVEKLEKSKAEKMKAVNKQKKSCIKDLMGAESGVSVYCKKIDCYFDLYNAYVYAINNGVTGVFKDCILDFFKVVGIADKNASYTKGNTKVWVESACQKFGVVVTSDRAIYEEGAEFIKAMTRARFNKTFIGFLVVAMAQNGAMSNDDAQAVQA